MVNIVQSLANESQYMECNDTCPTSSRAVYISVETALISHNKADHGEKLSDFDSL